MLIDDISVNGVPNIRLIKNSLEYYDSLLSESKKHLAINGKQLGEACYEHASWVYYYEQLCSDVKSLYRTIDTMIERVRGQLYKQFNENYNRNLSDRQIDKYIDQNETYAEWSMLKLYAEDVKGKFEALSSSFYSRGFMLKNITELRINNLHTDVI